MRARLLCLFLIPACATTRAVTPGGPPPEVSAPPAGASPAEVAAAEENAELRKAMGAFSFATPDPARAGLEAFVARHPGSPRRGFAAALLARLALARGDGPAARTLLATYAAGSSEPTVLFVQGLAEARAGRPDRAVALLTPFASSGPPRMDTDPEEAELSLHAALGDALAGSGDVAGGLLAWERYAQASGAREAERAYARARAEELAAQVRDAQALELYRGTRSALARAALGPRAAAALRARGDADGARRLDEETASLRRSLSWSTRAAAVGPGDPHRLGLLAPFSGSAALLGDVVLRGAMLAIGEGAGGAEPPPFQIVARDIAPERRAAERAAFELCREEAAIGVVGVGDRRAVDGAVRDGVPVLLIDEQAPGAASTAFQILHPPEMRAAELARRALALGARRFGVLAPDSAAGRQLGAAFSRAVATGGGRVVAEVSYPAGATAFTAQAAQLRKAPLEAVFIPDDARRLELIAPALAAGDLWSQPWGAPAPAREPNRPAGQPARRNVLLLSTAVGLGPQLLRNAGRYVQGALLAPLFYADPDDARTGRFVAQFRNLYGQDPGGTDAYGYDAFRLLSAAVERGARSRADLLRVLQSESFDGVTGTVRFGPDHARVDPPAVYLVDGDAIRALR
jgi:ABC-type branched-subunit amino acid transport system substrate-binding protein